MANGGSTTSCLPFAVASTFLLVSLIFSSFNINGIMGISVEKAQPSDLSNLHHLQHQSRMQVFVQTPTELRLVIDGLTIQSAADLVDYALLMPNPTLQFDPSEVDFGETEFSTAAHRRVTVHNPSSAVVHLLTITGSTAHYHCSFFEENILFPGANTTFDVYFLPRERGNLSSVLEVHTSIDVFALKLRGTGVDSRYQLLPAINMKLPTNTTFVYLMSLYNPYPRNIEIQEIFTTSAELHLELATGKTDEVSKVWRLRPYETRPVLFLEFKGTEATHFHAYIVIEIKVFYCGKNSEIVKLFVPVDFEVSDGVGLFPASPILDFGIISPFSPITTLPIQVYNSYSRPVLVQSITMVSFNPALTIDFFPARVSADYSKKQTVAFVGLNSSMLTTRQQLNGEISIVVKGSHNNTSVVPYRIRFISDRLKPITLGNLSFNCQEGHCDWQAPARYISLINGAKSQIVLYTVTVRKCEYPSPYQIFLNIQSKNFPRLFSPKQSHKNVFSINIRKVSSEESRSSRCGVILHTSAGNIDLDVDVWDGKFEVFSHFAPASNFYTHDVSIIYTGNEDAPVVRTLSLYNPNPVTLKIRKFDGMSPYLFARVIGVSETYKGNIYSKHNFLSVKNVTLPSGEIPVPPYHYALVEFFVNATEPPAIDSLTNVLMWIITDQPNRTPIIGSVLFDHGNYFSHPDPIIIDNCFPGRICSDRLVLSHSYRSSDVYRPYSEDDDVRPHQLQFLEFLPVEEGFSYQFNDTQVYFAEKAQTATVNYDPMLKCGDLCYVGLSHDSILHSHWLATCNLDSLAADIDSYLILQLRRRWQHIKETGQDVVNTTLAVLSSENMPHLTMPHHTFIQVHLTIPKLIHSPYPLSFGVVEVGQFDMVNFTIVNPSFLPLAIQLVFLQSYPAANNRLLPWLFSKEYDTLRSGDETYDEAVHSVNGPAVFSFLDLNFTVNFNKLLTRNPGQRSQPFPGYARCSRRSITAVLKPNTNFTVHVRFAPADAIEYRSIILLRNNLTFVEPITIRGQGGQGNLILSDNKGRQLDKVELVYLPTLLADCNRQGPSLFMSLFYWLWLDEAAFQKATNEHHFPYEKAGPKGYPSEPPFTIRRTLFLRNLGRLPVYVTSVGAFGSSPGLRLIDVSGTQNRVIPTNGTINFQVSFSPDFQNWRYTWTLVVNSTISMIRYPVIVTLPPHLVSTCRAALPRPDWETMLRLTVFFIVIPNVIGALLFALCDAFYITSIIRQLNARLKQTSSHQNVSRQTSNNSTNSNQPKHSAKFAAMKNNNADQTRKIQIRVYNSQSVIATVIADTKMSRRERMTTFSRELLGKLGGLLWLILFGWFPVKLFSKKKPDSNEPLPSSTDAACGLAPANDKQPALPSSDANRSKSNARSNRQRSSRIGFRRVYGQLLPTNNYQNITYETNTPSEEPRGSRHVRPSKSQAATKKSGDDTEEIVQRPYPSYSRSLKQSQKSHEENDNSLSRASTGGEDSQEASIKSQPDADDDYEHTNATDGGETVQTGISNARQRVASSSAMAAGARNVGDGQSADDECSSLEDSNDDVESADEQHKRKPSPLSSAANPLANTSDEEHDVNKVTSSSSTESSQGNAQTTNWYPNNTGLPQKQTPSLRYRNIANQQQHQLEWRKQTRTSQPPRLQRHKLQTSNTLGEGNFQRPVVSSSAPINQQAQNTTSASATGHKISILPSTLYGSSHNAPSSIAKTMLPGQTGGEPVVSTPVNSPYLIAEAAMKRVVMESQADRDHKDARMGMQHSVPPTSHHQPPVPWANVGVKNRTPSIAETMMMTAQRLGVPKERTSWLSSASNFPFNPSSESLLLAHGAVKGATEPPVTSTLTSTPTTFALPSLQFAERLVDEPDTGANLTSNSNQQTTTTSTTSHLTTEFGNGGSFSWGSDPVWDPEQKQSNTNDLYNPTWDNPWAAHVVKTLWGSPDESETKYSERGETPQK